MKEIEKRLAEHKAAQIALKKKANRDERIRNETRIRTYDFTKGIVIDHRSGKRASLKDILQKGQIEKLR